MTLNHCRLRLAPTWRLEMWADDRYALPRNTSPTLAVERRSLTNYLMKVIRDHVAAMDVAVKK
jgi:hypothetical protein